MNNDVELIPVKGVLPSVQVQSDNVIYVPQAHKNKAGIVKEGDGVLIENGVVSLNRQTVEDMIDANKWVSYGFQQNLTEDEKGMARHNIGAGDNYFTGSYYDLTQKPHLNTNNTTGLDYGDEELNDTINLHKISKTGSFNDLKHVPQETLDFAESERQKSKNLFPYEIVSGNSISQKFFNALPAGTYTLSAIVSSATPDTQCLVEVYYNNTWVAQYIFTKSSIRTSETRTINSQFDELRFYGGRPNYAYDFTFSQVQLEEGSVATDYQPYNGAITHNGDAPVVFAESERQKSKNLLLVVDSSATAYDYTMTCKDGVFTINGGNGSDECTFILSGTGGVKSAPTKYYQSITLDNTNSIKLSAGTYTISATIPSAQMGIIYGDLGTTSKSGASNLNLNTNRTLTFTKTTYICVYRYLSGSVYNNVSLGSLQIEEGSVATEYQPYNGAIVHEKEVADVEHIETIYDYSDTNKQTIDGVAYTNGILFDTSATYTFENLRNKYKGVYVDIKLYTPSSTVTIYIPFTALSVAKSSFVGVNSNVHNNEIAYGVLYFENNILHPTNCASHNFTNTAGVVSNLNNNDRYSIIRIKGVLL